MSGKLDQSLDEIMKDTKPIRGRDGRTARPRRAATAAATKTATAAPVGGVAKKTRVPRGPKAATVSAVAAAPQNRESKIIVNNLPEDINESQIKDYFSATIGNVKRAMLTYGPQGRSRGIATIIFSNPTSANKAVTDLNGTKVDGRAMRVEIVLDSRSLPAAPAPKSLADRMSKPKNVTKEKPKAKAAALNTPKAASNATAKVERAAKKKSGRTGKPKPKTADELDAEMQDYFGGGEPNGATTNGAVQPVAAATGGDTGMDEIS